MFVIFCTLQIPEIVFSAKHFPEKCFPLKYFLTENILRRNNQSRKCWFRFMLILGSTIEKTSKCWWLNYVII